MKIMVAWRRCPSASEIMLNLALAFVSVLLLSCDGASAQQPILGSSATSLCAELINPAGYVCREYRVTTGDGFVLGLYNIPYGQGVNASAPGAPFRPPVVIQHGLVSGGDIWLVNPPQEALGFVLADAGFDVWIANNRDVQWSHGSVQYVPSQAGYWNWSYDELASFDLQATLKFVYNQTGGTKVSYVGHSQGTLMLFAGLTGSAFKSEVLSYLKSAVLLAPVANVSHITVLALQIAVALSPVTYPIIGPAKFDVSILFKLACTTPLTSALCDNVFTLLLGPQSYLNQSRVDYYANYFPQPTSTKNFNHFSQSYLTNTFQKYDYGSLGNQQAYNSITPPAYDLTKFPTSLPIQLWTGGIDALADPTDVGTLLSQLPTANRTVINLPTYGHADFVLGFQAYLDIYPRLIQFLRQ